MSELLAMVRDEHFDQKKICLKIFENFHFLAESEEKNDWCYQNIAQQVHWNSLS